MDVTEKVGDYAGREALLVPRQRLVVGVSGGPDSLCLMDCLNRLGYRLVIAHYDHRLRPESASEAEQVRSWAKRLRLPVVVGRAPSEKTGKRSEEQSRQARYRFLARVARRRRIGTIAVGHTADDQVETVLMHLLRGAGPTGLRGMLPRTSLGEWPGLNGAGELTLVRPLLELRRSETTAHCAQHGLDPIQDPSNRDPRYFRNRLRHELIPLLQQYSPAIESILLRTARLMASEADLVARLVDGSWDEWVGPVGPGVLRLRRAPLLAASESLQQAALRRAIQTLRPELRDIDFGTVERALAGVRDRRRQSLAGGLELLPYGEDLLLRGVAAPIRILDHPQLRSARARRLRVPGSVRLANRWAIVLALPRRSSPAGRGADRVLFDLDRLPEPLMLRAPRPADRMQPMGMRGTLKLADLFINRKVPQAARARWPVVTSGERVLWVPSLHWSRHARPTRRSKQVVELILQRPPP